MTADGIVRTQFRIPASLFEALARAAKENQRSANGELVVRLTASFGESPAPAPAPTPTTAYATGRAGRPITLVNRFRKLEIGSTDQGVVVHLLTGQGDHLTSARSGRGEFVSVAGRDLCFGGVSFALDISEIGTVNAWLAGRFGATL
jgi:Arc-like DNA binding domain